MLANETLFVGQYILAFPIWSTKDSIIQFYN
jgi:hypothetical protein